MIEHSPSNQVFVRRLARRAAAAAAWVLCAGLVSAAHVPQAPVVRSVAKPFVAVMAAPVVETTKTLVAPAVEEMLHDVSAEPTPAAPLPTRAWHAVRMEVTAYCACEECCGPSASGVTASGKRVSYNDGRFVAADRSFKFGSKLIIPGYADNQPVEVIDRGGAIKGHRLDLFFTSHDDALAWGRQQVEVIVME